jgi:hypothetical protein
MLTYKLSTFFFCFSDASEPWQLGLQDPATSVVEGMIFFHDYLMFFLIGIGFFLLWISYIILKNFDENTNFSIINFTHYSPLEFMGTANRVDVILLTSIFLFSTLFYCLTMIVKINFLIFKLRIQIKAITNIISLLDEKLLSLAQQADNRMIMTAIGIAVVIVIGLLFFFFSGGGPGPGPGGSSITSDSFTPRGSEGSLSRAPSSTDLGGKYTQGPSLDNPSLGINDLAAPTPEATVVETTILGLVEPLKDKFTVIFEKVRDQLLPTLDRSNWLDSANNKISFFQDSHTVKVGSSVKEWLSALKASSEKIAEKGEISIDVLQSVAKTVDSINEILPVFIDQLDLFLAGAKLNGRPYLQTEVSDFEFIISCRNLAKELLEKLSENETLLTQGSIVFPEWFPGLLCFFSTLNVACSEEVSNLLSTQIRTIFEQLKNHPFKSDLKDFLIRKLYDCYISMMTLMNSTSKSMSSINYLRETRVTDDIHAIPKLLDKLYEHHGLLNVDPNHIFLFLG